MKKSEIMQVIREEVEVVLTNEEAVEMFDLDSSALLDELLNEEGYQQNPARKKRLRQAFNRFTKTGPNTAGPFKSVSDDPDWKSAPPGAPGGLEEEEYLDEEDRPDGIPFSKLKKGRCTPMGTPECPEGSPQYNLAKAFKGKIRKSNLKRGKNPDGPG